MASVVSREYATVMNTRGGGAASESRFLHFAALRSE